MLNKLLKILYWCIVISKIRNIISEDRILHIILQVFIFITCIKWVFLDHT